MNEQKLYEILSAPVPVPEQVRARMTETCQSLPERQRAPVPRLRPRWRRTLLAAAMVTGVLAISAAGASLLDNGAFYEALFGNGSVTSRDVEAVYDPAVDDTYILPGSQRVPVDQEQADALVGQAVAQSGAQAQAGGCTFTLAQHLYDPVSATGRLYFTVANPDGLEDITIFPETNEAVLPGEMGRPGPGLTIWGSQGTQLAGRVYRDPAQSDDTRMALYFCYTANGGLAQGEQVQLHIWLRGTNGEETPQDAAVLTVPAGQPLEGVTATAPDGTWAARFSAVGMVVNTQSFESGDAIESVALICADGSRYVVISREENLDNTLYATQFNRSNGMAVDWNAYLFNRLVDPAKVTAAEINGQSFPITPAG